MVADIEEQLNQERRRVDVDTNNFPVRELVRMMFEGELNIAPAYQRKFRWPAETESALIESVFLGLPIPSIFVATNEGFEWEVVDGLQRLSTLLHFVEPGAEALVRIGRETPLRLEGLGKVEQLNGLTFVDLPKPLQIYFGRQPLQITALTDKSDLKVRYDLFERLNRGAVRLSEQEVRACLYGGEFNELIDELAALGSFQSLLKLQPAKQNDGTAEEIVLKFFAYLRNRDQFSGRVKEFLNEYLEGAVVAFDLAAGRELFTKAAAELSRVLDGKPYLRADYGVTPLVQLEACLVAVGDLILASQPIGSPSPDWVNDETLKSASMGGTNTKKMLKERIERAKTLLAG